MAEYGTSEQQPAGWTMQPSAAYASYHSSYHAGHHHHQQQQPHQHQHHHQPRGGRGGGRGGNRQFRGGGSGGGTGNPYAYATDASYYHQPSGGYYGGSYGGQMGYQGGASHGGAAPPPYGNSGFSDGGGYYGGEGYGGAAPSHDSSAYAVAQQAPALVVDETGPDFCKALAKVAKPCPPWSIGTSPTENLAEEVGRLDSFIAPHQRDTRDVAELWEGLKAAACVTRPNAVVQYLGANSWGFFPYKARLSVAVLDHPDDAVSVAAFLNALTKHGFDLNGDFKGVCGATCVLVTHIATGRGAIVRIGEAASAQVRTVDAIRSCQRLMSIRQALTCLIVLLRQSKIIDDSKDSPLSDEAVAVMVLSIANSYPEVPPTDRVVIDFFLTFGFKEHFSIDKCSVTMAGMISPTAKIHVDDVLSVPDPADSRRNLAAGITEQKMTFIRSSLEYCYHVVSEFQKEAVPQNRRGQSPLSTMIGGEPYWPRVLDLAKQNVEPYSSYLNAHRAAVLEEVGRAAMRKATHRR